MDQLRPDDDLAGAVVGAIRAGDVVELRRLLREHPGLAAARIAPHKDCDGDVSRTLLHVATDWPGHFPDVGETIRLLVEAGAEVDARNPPGSETALHWAASSDDVEALDALVAAGADVEAPGAVIAGGTPLDDAVAFGQWQTARRLVEHCARTALWHAAALGLSDRVSAHFAGSSLPATYRWGGDDPPDDLTVAFWCACHGGQRTTAELLLERGAPINWVATWDGLTPVDTARREGADDLVTWLRSQGGKSAEELSRP